MFNRLLKKLTVFIIILTTVSISCFAYSDIATGQSLDITAQGAILIDLDTDTILYKRNMNKQCRPASLTKMMTLLVAYEQTAGRHNELITLTKEMIDVPSGSSDANLKVGDMISLYDLFYAMMLPSGNDAAKAIAYVVSGNEENFANLMNDKAKALGMKDSNFKNAHGFDEDGHYTTTYDLALLSEALCENSELVKIFSSYKYTATIYSNGNQNLPSSQTYYNSNNLLNPNKSIYMPGYKGIKTGFTKLAGNCLASYYEKDGRRLVAVVTFCEQNQRDNDMVTLLNYGIKNFDTLNLREVFSSKRIVVDLENAEASDESNGQLELYLQHPEEDKYITLSASEGKRIRTFDESALSIRYPVLQAPQKAGDEVGTVEYIYNNQTIYSATAKASRNVDAEIESPMDLVSLGIKGRARFSLGFLTSKYFLIPLIIIIALFLIGFLFIKTRRRQFLRVRTRQQNGIGRTQRKRNSSRPGNRPMV